MVVKVFIGKESEHEHELDQLEEVYNLINNKYANNELIYLLSNFRLSNTEIDVLIMTKNGMAILDLKSYKGKIIGSENGDWTVITENGIEKLPKNLFEQLQEKKFAFRRKLFRIQGEGNFEHIEKELLAKIKCWGYFKKGSSYDIGQVDSGVHIWFDIITADKLLKKMRFINAGYELRHEEMDAIVKGFNLKEYSFEKYAPAITQASVKSHIANIEELRTPKKEDAVFEKTEHQMAHASHTLYVEERMHGYVLEHRHPQPSFNHWHPVSESHANAERMFDGVIYHIHSGYDYWHLPSETHDEAERICKGISEHKHSDYDYWHPVSENHETLAKVEERMHRDVLEHKHPDYDYWHPASRIHKIEDK